VPMHLEGDLFEDTMARATESFQAALGLKDGRFIKLTLREVPPGAFVTKEESLQVRRGFKDKRQILEQSLYLSFVEPTNHKFQYFMLK